MFASAYLAEYKPANIAIVTATIVIPTFFSMGMGTLLGLFAKSVREASVLIMPIIIVFSFGSSATAWAERYPISKAAEYLPNIQLLNLAKKVEDGAGFGDVVMPFAVLAAWVVVIAALTVIIYRKRMVDLPKKSKRHNGGIFPCAANFYIDFAAKIFLASFRSILAL